MDTDKYLVVVGVCKCTRKVSGESSRVWFKHRL